MQEIDEIALELEKIGNQQNKEHISNIDIQIK